MRATCLVCVLGTAFILSSVQCHPPDIKMSKHKAKSEFQENLKYRQDEETVDDSTEQTSGLSKANSTEPDDATAKVETCPICQARELQKKFRLDKIKEKILAELDMTEPPNITGPLPKIPTHLLLKNVYPLQSDDPDPYAVDKSHATTEKVITFASKMPPTNAMSDLSERTWQGFCYFNLPMKIRESRVVRARLWLYIKPTKVVQDTATWLHIYQILPPDRKSRQSIIRSKKTDLSHRGGHWENFDFTHVVNEWVTDPESNLGIAVEAMDHEDISVVVTDTGDDQAKRPFLEIRNQRQNIRKKRSSGMKCNEHSSEKKCCHYPLTVDFEEFGWDWIIAPKIYEANYCAGECPHNFLPKYSHTHITEGADINGNVGACCTAVETSEITMLYFNTSENILFGRLPNMVVESCGCA
ncbi:growth/differentiation factor 8-like [Ptychodera flava]|uniref:growth/differentiation factor 8-like n=1 Tax=Ptychodera flava TaxID=63121 RepID=UPI00396A5674